MSLRLVVALFYMTGSCCFFIGTLLNYWKGR